MTPPPDDQPRRPSRRLRSAALQREVEQLLREERYELAVLLSQTLLEVHVEGELVEFFQTIGERRVTDATLDLLSSYNIGNGRVQRFFERLVGVRLRDEHGDAMAALRAHVKRRNAVAHSGEQVGALDARASLSAVLTVCQIVHELSYRALGLDDILEEEAREVREQLWGDEGDEEDWS